MDPSSEGRAAHVVAVAARTFQGAAFERDALCGPSGVPMVTSRTE